MEPLVLRYEWTRREYGQLYRRACPPMRPLRRVVAWSSTGILALDVVLHFTGYAWSPYFYSLSIAIVISSALFAWRTVPDIKWARSAATSGPRDVTIDQSGIHILREGVGKTLDYAWAAFDHFVETKKFYILFRGRRIYWLGFPKRVFETEASHELFRQYLHSCVKSHAEVGAN